MSTRSLVNVYNEQGERLVTMYNHYDGYPSYFGKELLEFLDGFQIVNGIPLRKMNSKFANGMDCLAAQIVAHFKTQPGNIYLCASDSGYGEEYIYNVRLVNGKIKVTVKDVYENTETDLEEKLAKVVS